ncbi:MAG TPA: hypothetical protein VGJ81_12500 [Thermoanaerobaculia bacterium]|jgi:hypothetical protein
MAVGNIRIASKPCASCGRVQKFERNALVWGGGDLVLVLLTWGAWAILKILINAGTNPWRCSRCGARG